MSEQRTKILSPISTIPGKKDLTFHVNSADLENAQKVVTKISYGISDVSDRMNGRSFSIKNMPMDGMDSGFGGAFQKIRNELKDANVKIKKALKNCIPSRNKSDRLADEHRNQSGDSGFELDAVSGNLSRIDPTAEREIAERNNSPSDFSHSSDFETGKCRPGLKNMLLDSLEKIRVWKKQTDDVRTRKMESDKKMTRPGAWFGTEPPDGVTRPPVMAPAGGVEPVVTVPSKVPEDGNFLRRGGFASGANSMDLTAISTRQLEQMRTIAGVVTKIQSLQSELEKDIKDMVKT